MPTDVIWEDPPEGSPRGNVSGMVTRAFLAAVKAEPGRWGRHPTTRSQKGCQVLASHIRTGQYGKLDPFDWEVTAPKTGGVFARYRHHEGLTADVIWEDPPKRKFADEVPWAALLRKVQERPGEWARIHNGGRSSGSMVHRLKQGMVRGINPAEWEFRTRTTVEGTFIYARYAEHLEPQ